MASALNKRQQARNERALQELIKTVPGNSTCADCGARNPGWASWSLGIFLCMRCAALHRKLGTHISKVKSLSMDKWDNAQVDNMKRMGNIESNKAYNPRNVKPQIPIDVDEVDGAIERYIRQEYQERAFLTDSRPGTRQNTGSTSSVEDRPPPLPPKPNKRFGFGLQKSSTYPRNTTPPASPGMHGFGEETSPPRVNKASRVFGSNVSTSGDGLDSKLATLRDMGFPDDKRNSTVLKGLNGNLDRAVEALIRLGEQNVGKSRGNTPTPPAKPATNGLSFDRTNTAPATTTSMNPFDALDMVPQQPQPIQTQQVSAGINGAQPTSPSNPYNPFLGQQQQQQQSFPQQGYSQQQPQQQQQQQPFAQQQNPFGQQQQNLEQSFQGLQLSNPQPQQPLFPNRTGGYGQVQSPQYPQTNPFQQSFTPPPMPQIPQHYQSFFQPQQSSFQPLSSQTGAANPFLKTARSQMFSPTHTASNPFDQPQQQQQQQQASNPFMSQNQTNHIQQQAPNPWQTQSNAAQSQAPNPWQNQQQAQQSNFAQQPQQPSFQQQQHQQHQQHQQQQQQPFQGQLQQQNYQQSFQSSFPQSQAPTPFDKSSILALYNYPHLAPTPTQQPQTQSQNQPQPQTQVQPTQPPPSSATPLGPSSAAPGVGASTAGGTMNPFAAGVGAAQQPQRPQPQPAGVQSLQNGGRHVSNESVDFAGLMGGRHSPDAFSGLSASFRR